MNGSMHIPLGCAKWLSVLPSTPLPIILILLKLLLEVNDMFVLNDLNSNYYHYLRLKCSDNEENSGNPIQKVLKYRIVSTR